MGKKLTGWLKQKQKENIKDLDNFENDLYNLLRTIYKKGEIPKKSLKKKLNLEIKRLDEILEFGRNKGYIKIIDTGEDLNYKIKKEGLEYLISFRRTKIDKNHSKTIKWATIVLAFSAFVNVVDILIYKRETRDFIVKKSGEILAVIFQTLAVITLIILGIWIIGGIIKGMKKLFF